MRWVLLMLGAAVLAGLAFSYPMLQRGPPATPDEKRPDVIAVYDPTDADISAETALNQINVRMRTFQEGGIVVIGDSLVARSGLVELCRLPVLKAGHPGARVRDWRASAPVIIGMTDPSLVVFALGINDLQTNFDTDIDEWAEEYERLIRAARPAQVALLSIMPVDEALIAPDLVSEDRIPEFNQRLATLAQETGASLIAPLPTVAGLTVDGVHFNEAGNEKWSQNLARVCSKLRTES